MVADALRFALDRDFGQAAALWREAVALSGSRRDAAATLRTVVDGFVRLGDLAQAWEPLRMLLDDAAAEPSAATGAAANTLVADGADPHLAVSANRWLQGRLATLFAGAAPSLREELDRHAATAAAQHAQGDAGGSRIDSLRQFIDRYGRHETALAARRRLAETIGEEIESAAASAERRDLVVARDLVLLELARVGLPADRAYAATLLAAERTAVAGAAAAASEAWPVGRVVPRRGAGLRVTVNVGSPAAAGRDLRFRRSRLMNIPVANGSDSFLPGLELAFDLHPPNEILAIDGFGRQLGEPLSIESPPDAGRPAPIFQAGGIDEASALGRLVFVRAGGSLAAFELSGQPRGIGQAAVAVAPEASRNRGLWMVADPSRAAADARAAGFVMNVGGGRAARDGSVPLGVRVSEPRAADDDARRMGIQGGRARCTGVPMLMDRTVRVHDPRTGGLIWERQRVPAGSELIGDDDVLVVCPPDGRGAIVLSMADGRVLRTLDVPAVEQRLCSSGRRIVAAQPTESRTGEALARRVRVDIVDPLIGARVPLGDFAGESRTAEAGPGRLAIVEPAGDLSLVDVDAERIAFRTQLSDMPAGLQQVQVLPWQDRYLVLVGRDETPEERRQLERIGGIGPLPGMAGRELPQVVTGSLWAVERESGEMLWPVPATLLRHSLERHQAPELPVMLFARSIQPSREPDRPRLSLLCLDKRTGQAVYVDERFSTRSQGRPDTMMGGVSISGDPATHTISFAQGGRDAADLQLEFTGLPAAPRPPFQAGTPPSAGAESVLDIEYWIKKAIGLPFRF
jgi:hypothetical protein